MGPPGLVLLQRGLTLACSMLFRWCPSEVRGRDDDASGLKASLGVWPILEATQSRVSEPSEVLAGGLNGPHVVQDALDELRVKGER